MSEKIDKLCQLLEDVDQQPATGSPSDEKHRQNIKLMIFRLEQRVLDLEHRAEDIQNVMVEGGEDEKEEKGGKAGKTPGASTPNLSTIEKQSPVQRQEVAGMKGVVAKHEMILNDVSLRISELENGMRKLEPNSIRTLIKDISELVMQEEKKEVSEEMNSLKGNQKRNIQLVEVLKEELKQMDERFRQSKKSDNLWNCFEG